jgi:hypothetical protein
LEKNFELPGVKTAFSSEVKPKDNGPVDLLLGNINFSQNLHFLNMYRNGLIPDYLMRRSQINV